jgi:hypothetical protein
MNITKCNVLSLLHASSHLCCFQSTNSAIIEAVVRFRFDIDDSPERVVLKLVQYVMVLYCLMYLLIKQLKS